ncbi:hypothetical protein E1193_02130 [Micromonospora sp. KC606]|uniref:hypothetical protein n=1 Tax=Micromonospora sp. KC606 TaxID=2530379 RepID=UPI0010537CE2|nr:hypothetical protein [Micromonospora sp. KC606]TDC85639.1 hypothetical protein E1193_02130 [Micromonospora sp. KC606]
MTGRAAAFLVGLSLAVAGCAGTAPPGDAVAASRRSAGPPTVHPSWESCATATSGQEADPDKSMAALSLPVLGDGFQPVTAVVCRAGPQQRSTGGSDLVAVEERAHDVAALVAALRLPDDTSPVDACTLEMPFVPWLALLDTHGRWVRPGVPTDPCGKPRPEFRAAYEQLPTRHVTTRVLRELKSDSAAASGCGQQWSDMVWATGQHGGGQDTTPGPLPAGDAKVRVCVYRVPEGERGGGKPAGEFESGRELPAARWTEIRRELSTAGPAAECATPGSRFAVLHLPAGFVYVQADGCRRVLIESGNGPGAIRQGTAKLASLLFGR